MTTARAKLRRAGLVLVSFGAVFAAIVVSENLWKEWYHPRVTGDVALAETPPASDKDQLIGEPNSPTPPDNSAMSSPPGMDQLLNDVYRMHRRMNQMFQDSFSSIGPNSLVRGDISMAPDADIRDEGDRYIVKMDLPGHTKADIIVSLDGQSLTVSGKRTEDIQREEKSKYFIHERTAGEFMRSFSLPGPVKQTGAKAKYENGVLSVEIPKDQASKSSGNRILVE